LTSITLTTGATVDGRTLARNGAVTLDTNTITRPSCSPATTRGTPTPGTTAGTGTGGTTGGTGGTTGPGGAGATGSGASNRGRALPVTGAPGWTGFALVLGAALILAGAFVNVMGDPLNRRIAAVRGRRTSRRQ
jgi:hypothetical protein